MTSFHDNYPSESETALNAENHLLQKKVDQLNSDKAFLAQVLSDLVKRIPPDLWVEWSNRTGKDVKAAHEDIIKHYQGR
jgi:hypothetical protein